jgi:WD40 repeat protein
MLKKLIFLVAALIVMLACSLQGASIPTVAPAASATPLVIIPSPAATLTNTPIPASPTPVPAQIGVDTVARLSISLVFGQGESLRTLVFSPDSTVLASAGGNTADFNIRLWDVGSGNLLRSLQGHTSIVWALAFSPDCQMLASVSKDGTARIWDWRNGSVLETLNFPGEATSVTFSPDGQTLAVGGTDGWPNAAIWTFSVPAWQPQLKLAEFWNIPALVYSPDGQYLVGGGTSRNVHVWRTSDGGDLFTLAHAGQVSSLAMSADGATVASGLCQASGDNNICTQGAVWFWDMQTGKLIRKLSVSSDWVEQVAYSVDGSLLIAGSRDGTLHFYSTSDFQQIFAAPSPGGGGIFAVSPDGRLLASAAVNGLIDLWQIGP